MEEFIRDANIRLFETKLAETTDPKERAELLKLLAEEKAKQITPADPSKPGSPRHR